MADGIPAHAVTYAGNPFALPFSLAGQSTKAGVWPGTRAAEDDILHSVAAPHSRARPDKGHPDSNTTTMALPPDLFRNLVVPMFHTCSEQQCVSMLHC
ncbi:hypothetical protein [Oryza sativa Japonica Group]|uniref:Uncharacterized protein n=1 Tax=Oryza sativa subsp. japonica TaxID=39947 RepID=Q5NA30_ORYSJ|nr:hypothetical protein [Oryza sativa Japonica Group]